MTYIPEEIYLRGVTGPIQPQIDSLSAAYYSLSGDIYSLSSIVFNLSSDVYTLSSTVNTNTNNILVLSSDIYSLSSTIITLSSFDIISLSSIVINLSSDVYTVSSAVNTNTNNILILSSDIINLSSTVVNLSSGGGGGKVLSTFGITIDAGTSVISTGIKGYCTIPYNCTINKWYIVADKVGSIVLDLWKANNTVPTVSNTITGTEKPTLSSQQINSDTTLTTWITSVSSNDIIAFNVDSANLVSRITLTIQVEK